MCSKTTQPAFAEEVCQAAATTWGFERAEYWRSFENVVFRVWLDGSRCYLRISLASRRGRDEIASELDLLNFLRRKGFPANVPLATKTGQLLWEFEQEGQRFITCVMSEAPGTAFDREPAADLGDFCELVGQSLGRLHVLLREYRRPPDFTRPGWNEDRWNKFEEVIPASESAAWELYAQLQVFWGDLDESADFGLIHGDFTIRNLHHTDQAISLFDFDGCCEHWYAYDLACFLHFFRHYTVSDRRIVFERFLAGYASRARLSDSMLTQLPVFCKMKLLRGFLVYVIKDGLDTKIPEVQRMYASRRQEFLGPGAWPPA